MKEKRKEKIIQTCYKTRKKRIIFSIIAIIFIFLILSTIFAIFNIWNENIINGVIIDNIDVSGVSRENLTNKLNDFIENYKTKEITLRHNDEETTISLESLNLSYDIENIVNKAYALGRDSNIFVNNFEIVKTKILKSKLNTEATVDKEKLIGIDNDLNSNLPDVVKESDYYIDGDKLIITKGKPGVKINSNSLNEKIEKAINNYSTNNEIIDIPVEQVVPKDIDIEKIYQEIHKEPKDAYITQNPTTVHPNIDGVDFAISINDAKKMLEEDKDEYIIPLKITIANKTLKDLGGEAFPDKLGSFSTKYDVENNNRVNNVNLATNKINGTIIMPGEIFSYNQTVGKRTIESGYKEAGAYSNGQIVQEIGGGICQVSSTLYNAVLYANLEVVERYNHYFESTYVDAGRDATVSWGSVDFKFKNSRQYPIKIVATSNNGVETIDIKGLKEATEYEVIVQSKVTSKIDRSIKYEDDNTLDEGKEIIEQNGDDGCTSETYRILRLNGKIISNTLISSDRYNALDRIIRRGTKTD